MTLPISKLQEGQKATVCGFGDLEAGDSVRLVSMGLYPGTIVQMIRQAPSNGAVALRIGSRQLALQYSIAAAILTLAT